MCSSSTPASSSSFAAFKVAPHSLQSNTRTSHPPPGSRPQANSAAWNTLCVPVVEREDGVSLFWEEVGAGPSILVVHSYIQHPKVMEGLMTELATSHRVVRYDPRG